MIKQELEQTIKQKELLLNACKDLIKKQNDKLLFIEKRLSRQNRIINEYIQINEELKNEILEYRNIEKEINKKYLNLLKEI